MLFLPSKCIGCTLTHHLLLKQLARTVPCCCKRSRKKYKLLDSKLQNKMMEIKAIRTGSSSTTTFRSINSMILRFPQFRQGICNITTLFDQFDKDSDGTIGREDVERFLRTLSLNLNKDQVDELFDSCDMDKSQSIQFNEFIVLLCLAYILKAEPRPSATFDTKMNSEFEAIFGTVVEAFMFLDKNGDGKLHKKDVMKALNDAFPWERYPKYIARNRLSMMIYMACRLASE
ncbi:hypothetical protein QQ045_031924 [Rhodiola kirilowii]